ncbi:putative Sugar transporter STL1 (putative) [Rhodotorula toruloides]|uniref:BY PROTMAP: gi/472581205/gb/EMS18954.1/ MFS transporter, sugar transporter [Rhodosporidium toruloides NP11] gi/647402851/emb/CDR49053.1/ RHTO0S22e02124g1_1 [Rhodosporidium toruloides] n=1 Tax=Rhodotorula toruloides TaxID=5286 RepID=A0A0K3CR85_RHOTO|nr:putative Sugar transporter STL1 (putative) [Rhodotorula toruloides]PRQ70452.1 general substrate transporter [Rhodotorula toruloides]
MEPTIKEGSSRRLVLAISCFASLGVFLFGYDQGVMSGLITNPFFRSYFHQPSRVELATMVAILEIGALITSLLAGRVGDIFGRRATIFAGACIFSLGGLFQAFTTGFRMMVFGRILSGFGVGFLSMCVPVYQSEISPAENRGRLGCIEFTGNIFGYASSVWIDYFASYITSDLSWRFPLLMQSVIGIILAIGTLFLPESPRWLIDTEQDEEGMGVLADLHGDGDPEDERAKEEFREIKEGVLAEREFGDRTYKAMWRRYKYRVLIAMSAQFCAQLNGINVISYYAPLVFEQAGWIGRDAILMTGINSIVYIASTVPTWYLVDTLGRRPILLSGAATMAVALTLVGFFLYLDAPYTPNAVVGCVIIYNAAFGFSWGPIPWLYPAEILPNAFRVKGVSLSTAANWLSNYVVGEATPILQETIEWRLYPMHAGFCVFSFILVYFAYPETMGVPLEEMDELFGDQPRRPLLPTSDEEGEHAPLRRSHSIPTFRHGRPHSHADDVEPPYPRNHKRTLSGASLPGRGSDGVEAVRGWWSGSQGGSSRGGSRPTTPRIRDYQAVRQETDDERP